MCPCFARTQPWVCPDTFRATWILARRTTKGLDPAPRPTRRTRWAHSGFEATVGSTMSSTKRAATSSRPVSGPRTRIRPRRIAADATARCARTTTTKMSFRAVAFLGTTAVNHQVVVWTRPSARDRVGVVGVAARAGLAGAACWIVSAPRRVTRAALCVPARWSKKKGLWAMNPRVPIATTMTTRSTTRGPMMELRTTRSTEMTRTPTRSLGELGVNDGVGSRTPTRGTTESALEWGVVARMLAPAAGAPRGVRSEALPSTRPPSRLHLPHPSLGRRLGRGRARPSPRSRALGSTSRLVGARAPP